MTAPFDGTAPQTQGPIASGESDDLTDFILALCAWPATGRSIVAGALQDAATADRPLRLARRHGLAPILFAAAAAGAVTSPVADPTPWKRAYYVQGAKSAQALEELGRVARALKEVGAPVLALKGAASLLTVYDDPALRSLSDLDLLIRPTDLDRVVAALEALGYVRLVRCTSAEEEWLKVMLLDGVCLTMPGRVPLEVHATFLGGTGDRRAAVRDAWDRSAEVETATGETIRVMAPEHAYIAAACHLSRNASRSLPYMKDVADLLLLARATGAAEGWDRLWSSCAAWGVAEQVRGVAAFLNAHLGAQCPGVRGVAPAFTPAGLVHSLERLEGRGRLTEGLGLRLGLVGHLPGPGARVRFLFRLVFPQPDFIRWRYRLGAGEPLARHYARHLLKVLRRTCQDALLRVKQRRRV